MPAQAAPTRRSSPRVRGEGGMVRKKTRTRHGEGAYPRAQTRGGAPHPDLLPASGGKERACAGGADLAFLARHNKGVYARLPRAMLYKYL